MYISFQTPEHLQKQVWRLYHPSIAYLYLSVCVFGELDEPLYKPLVSFYHFSSGSWALKEGCCATAVYAYIVWTCLQVIFLASIEKVFHYEFLWIWICYQMYVNVCMSQHDWSVLSLDKHLLILSSLSSLYYYFPEHSSIFLENPAFDSFLSSFSIMSPFFSSSISFKSFFLWSSNLFRFFRE